MHESGGGTQWLHMCVDEKHLEVLAEISTAGEDNGSVTTDGNCTHGALLCVHRRPQGWGGKLPGHWSIPEGL